MQVSICLGSLLGFVMIGSAASNGADLDGRLGVRDVSVRAHPMRAVVATDGCGWRCRGAALIGIRVTRSMEPMARTEAPPTGPATRPADGAIAKALAIPSN
jgi:hypothetical protein